MTTTQVVEMSVTNNSLSKDYPHLDNHTRQITDTPGLKPFTNSLLGRLCGPTTLSQPGYAPEVPCLSLTCLVLSCFFLFSIRILFCLILYNSHFIIYSCIFQEVYIGIVFSVLVRFKISQDKIQRSEASKSDQNSKLTGGTSCYLQFTC